MKKLSIFFVVVLMATLFTSCKKEKEVTGFSLDKSTLTIKTGEWETLTATVSPAKATDKTVAWASSNPNVVTVTGGIVTAFTAGKATIIAKAGNQTATCEVTVPTGLEGTTWKGWWDGQFTVNFVNETFCSATMSNDYYSGTYTIVSQNISFTLRGQGYLTYTFSGTVSGNKMTLNIGDSTIVLTKQ